MGGTLGLGAKSHAGYALKSYLRRPEGSESKQSSGDNEKTQKKRKNIMLC
jgi:hypothetical protein